MTHLLYRAAGWVISALAENRLVPKQMLGNRSVKRIKFLRSLDIRGGVGAEIGVQKGFFSHVLIATLKPQRLHLIDPWYLLGKKWLWASGNKSTTKALRNVIYWFQEELTDRKVVLNIGFDEEVLANLPDRYFDWVYLDTSHEREHTRRELALLQRKVKPGGVIMGDDWFTHPDHHFFGQYEAIEEFRRENDYVMAYASDENHQWAIRLPVAQVASGHVS